MARYRIRKDRADTTGYPWYYWGVADDGRLDYGSRETQALALESVIHDDRENHHDYDNGAICLCDGYRNARVNRCPIPGHASS